MSDHQTTMQWVLFDVWQVTRYFDIPSALGFLTRIQERAPKNPTDG